MSNKLNLFFFDIDGVLLPLKWYQSEDVPLHIYNFINTLKQNPKNKIIMASSWCSDDIDLFKFLKKNNIQIDWKINGDVELSWNKYKEVYIAEFIWRDKSLNNREYDNIIVIDDQDVSIDKIQNILLNKYNININSDIFLKITPHQSMWIMGNDIKKVFKKIYNIKDTNFESIKNKVNDIKKDPDNNIFYIFPDENYINNVNDFFKERYNEKEKYFDCMDYNKDECQEQDIFQFLGYDEPKIIDYNFMWKTYKWIRLWFDNEDIWLNDAYMYFKNKLL